MYWHPKIDNFQYKVNFQTTQGTVTKRLVLSTIAKLFDPLGFINPVIVVAKIFLKKLWLQGLEWDEELSDDLCKEWTQIVMDMSNIQHIQIPRWLNTSKTATRLVEIHAFCDGSTQAYASIVYLRTQDENQRFYTNIVTAKSKVTPKPEISIPRIELCGACLSIKLVQWVCKYLPSSSQHIPIYYWTDSTIVLCWIRGNNKRWPVFIANRVGLILSASNVNQWHHVSTHDNPADYSSRGISAQQLLTCDTYWHGPQWLKESQNQWPSSDWTFLEEEIHPVVNAIDNTRDSSLLNKFSSFTRLRRITAWINQFRHNCMVSKQDRLTGSLRVNELQSSLIKLVRLVQAEQFEAELRCLAKGESLPNKSRLLSLNPFLDNDQIMRVGGRLQQSCLTYDEKHPMILPETHHFTTLVIHDSHLNTLHGGHQLVGSFIRKKFWILSAYKRIRSYLKTCVICFRQRPKIAQQLMGNLPKARITPPARPFLQTGIDYTGAIELKASRFRGTSTYKGYVAIFICLATKAIHLEAVTGMTTAVLLSAIYRFIGRRGICQDIYSDCGTNFIGAASVLKTKNRRFVSALEEEILPQLSDRGIQWHFNPPYSPNFGGIWEANIKSVKAHLTKLLFGHPLTYEDLSTVLVRIEACLNSRPLCPLTSDADDMMVLTPGHFLIGDALQAPPSPADLQPTLYQHYLSTQRMIKQFWSRWSSDWLSHLQSRPKWCTQQPNLETGELVLIKEENLPPQRWTLGRIREVHPGKDNLVRVVTVQTRDGTFSRSVSKICRLPLPS